MAISSINNTYNNYFNGSLSNTKSEASETADAILAKHSSTKNAYAAYGSSMYSGAGQSAMQRAIQELKDKNGGTVTFSMVSDYRAEMEEDFKTLMMGGLALLGFEETDEFQMLATSDGTIEILSDNAEVKAAVEFMLEDSPKLQEQFLYIQALGNIERAKTAVNPQMQLQEARANLGSEAVDILLNGSNFLNQVNSLGIGYSALMANYSQNNIQYTLGANYLV